MAAPEPQAETGRGWLDRCLGRSCRPCRPSSGTRIDDAQVERVREHGRAASVGGPRHERDIPGTVRRPVPRGRRRAGGPRHGKRGHQSIGRPQLQSRESARAACLDGDQEGFTDERGDGCPRDPDDHRLWSARAVRHVLRVDAPGSGAATRTASSAPTPDAAAKRRPCRRSPSRPSALAVRRPSNRFSAIRSAQTAGSRHASAGPGGRQWALCS